jgi:threonine dehydrogenase-like Zn-dependent dehydrogenase
MEIDMRAMVFTGPEVVEMQDVPDALAGDGDVIVHVDRAGICGSELHGIKNPGFRVPPLIMGHEFVGHTADGQRVAVNPLVSCSTCDRCRAGKTQLCRTRWLLGVHRAGGFAERVAVPRTALHQLPDEIDWDHAALIEPLANAMHAWTLAGAPRGAKIGVIGCGPIGLCCIEIARHGGAASVAGADLSSERRAVAASLGADASSELDGEFDVIFDAVGTGATRAMSLERLIPGGTAIWLGLATPEAGFDAAGAVRFEKSVRGSFAYRDAEFGAATQLAAKLDLSWTTTYPLDQGASIFTALMNGQSSPIKALLQPN